MRRGCAEILLLRAEKVLDEQSERREVEAAVSVLVVPAILGRCRIRKVPYEEGAVLGTCRVRKVPEQRAVGLSSERASESESDRERERYL